MTKPGTLTPKFATQGAGLERAPIGTAAPAAPPELATKLATLTPEQLGAVERLVDTLRAGATPPSEPPPLEVLATRWWYRMDASGGTRPLVLQRVRGLSDVVLQLPPRFSSFDALISGGGLLYTLRANPNAPDGWFRGQAARCGAVPHERSLEPLPSAPWAGYAPRTSGEGAQS